MGKKRVTGTGPGFAFVGRQGHLEVVGDDFYIDLLFFHVEQLRYVALVDDKLRRETPNDTVGILICGSKNDHTVRYALGRSKSPMAVSTYTYENLPVAEQRAMPAADELAAAFDEIASESAEQERRNPLPEPLPDIM